MLSRFGLKFPSAGNIRHQGQVNIQDVLSAPVPGELSDRFQERESFDVTDRSADLANCDIVTLGGGENSPLDLVRYVGNHLHCAAKVIAPSLFRDYGLVNLAGGAIIFPAHSS